MMCNPNSKDAKDIKLFWKRLPMLFSAAMSGDFGEIVAGDAIFASPFKAALSDADELSIVDLSSAGFRSLAI